jgi:glyoxylase-like metal-dependent hydrolase (beta-lactamase superfamily II)
MQRAFLFSGIERQALSEYNRSMGKQSAIFESFPVGPLQCNCTIAGDTTTGEAIVIDPGEDLPEIERRLAAHKLTVKQIVITHAHFDHVGAALALKRKTGAPILLNERDLPLLKMMELQASWFGVKAPEVAPPDQSPSDGDTIGLATLPAMVLLTPGHSQGSICLHFPAQKLLLAGDTLFAGGIGRTDLPGGSTPQILDSIRTKLMPLPEETRVIPGHGPETTIGKENFSNPYLQD